MAVSSLPTRQEIAPVLLELLGDEREWQTGDIADKLADCYSLTSQELVEEVPSEQPRFYNRCSWAEQDLKEAGLVESAGYGSWRITERGLDVLAGIVPPPPYWRNWKPPKRG